MIQTQNNSTSFFGLGIAGFNPDLHEPLKEVLRVLFHSYHDVSWCRETIEDLDNIENVCDFLQDYCDEEPSFSLIEVNFTNYDEFIELQTHDRLTRIKSWIIHFGTLKEEEIKDYCSVFALDSQQALSINSAETRSINTSPQKIYDLLSKDVIGQNQAKKALAVELFNHSIRKQQSLALFNTESNFPKSNVLLVGPSGSGKTFLARKCAKILDVPFIKIDAASCVKSGIVGSTLMDHFQSYYCVTEDKEKLEYSIVLIDEFDKLATHYAYDRTAIQNELLNIIGEHGEASFEPSRNRPKVKLDCSKMLFILCGAFQDLTSEKALTIKIGYNCDLNQSKPKPLNRSAIQKFGFSTEIMNRIHKIIHLEKLSEKDIFKLLKNPQSSPVLPYKNVFAKYGKRIEFTDCFYTELASMVCKSQQNGRGPAAILSNVMEDIIFNITSVNEKMVIDAYYLKQHPTTC